MSGLLFLIAVGSFVIIAYWAYRNDGIQAGEGGSGLLAMVPFVAPKQKLVPRWKKIMAPEGGQKKDRYGQAALATEFSAPRRVRRAGDFPE